MSGCLPVNAQGNRALYYLFIYLHHSLSVSIETSSEWAWPLPGTRRRYSLPSRRSGYTKLHPPCSTDQSQPGHSTTLKTSSIVPDPACRSDQWERFTVWNTNWWAVSTNQNEGMRLPFFDGLVEPQDFYCFVSLNHNSGSGSQRLCSPSSRGHCLVF